MQINEKTFRALEAAYQIINDNGITGEAADRVEAEYHDWLLDGRELTELENERTTKPDSAASALSAGLGIPTDLEQLANAMQFGSAMVGKYVKVCRALNQEIKDADELLRLLNLDPQTYRTTAGFINLPKVKAALKNPEDYPRLAAPLSEEAREMVENLRSRHRLMYKASPIPSVMTEAADMLERLISR